MRGVHMEPRLERNIPSITESEQDMLRSCHVAVIGAGGLGGYAVEFLARLGIGTITVCDGDCFTESNLNRQLLSNSENLGKNKAEAASLRIKKIFPETTVRMFPVYLTNENAESILHGADSVIDALDSVTGRLLLEDLCKRYSIPLVHGAISGWGYQAALISPGSGLLHHLYSQKSDEPSHSVLPMTAAFCASLQMSLLVQYLLGRPVKADTLYFGSVSDPSISWVSLI